MAQASVRSCKGDVSISFEAIMMIALGAVFVGIVLFALLKKML